MCLNEILTPVISQTDWCMYSALARNCDAPIDDKKGATAKDWKKGKPIRVVSDGCGLSGKS